MRDIIDQGILRLFDGLYLTIKDSLGTFIYDAQALAAIFMIIYFAIKAYTMMTGDSKLEIMPLLRPFGIAFVIIFWGSFISVIETPADYLDDKARGLYLNRIEEVNQLNKERYVLIDSVAQRIIEKSREIEEAANDEGESSSIFEYLGIDIDSVLGQVRGLYLIVLSKFRFLMKEIIEFCVLTIFQALTYFVFFIKIIFAGILIIIGPFSFAFSILPGFKDAYISWISRFIGVLLYSTVGYIVLTVALGVIEYGITIETLQLRAILAVGNEDLFISYITGSSNIETLYIVALLVGGIGMLSVPIVSSWILSSASTANLFNKAVGGAKAVAGAAVTAGKAAAGGM